MSSTTFFFLFIPLLSFVLLAVNLVFAPHNPYQEKDSAFECGFSSFLGQNRSQFSVSFFIFGLLFLLFDLEILLVYPYLVSAYTNGVYGLTVLLVFLLALTLGFAFELGKKALSIDSRQILSSPPKPHAFVSLPVQSSINFRFFNKISLFLVTVFFTLALRWPFKMMLDQADMLVCYPVFNTCISLVLAYILTAFSLKKLSMPRIVFIIAMGAVFPLLIILITDNLDNVFFCIAALADFYTLMIKVFYPIESGCASSIIFATTRGGNIGSTTGAGVGSSTGAGVGSSTSAHVDSSSLSASHQEELEAIKADIEAIKALKEEVKEATDNLDFIAFKENLERKTASLMKEQKREIEYSCRVYKESDSSKKEQLEAMEKNFEEYFLFELEAHKLLLAAVNSPYAESWRKNQDSPGVILDLVQKSGVNAIHHVLNKDQRKSIYNQCKEAIKYAPYPKEISLTPNLNKQVSYLNVRARIQLELAALDETKRVNPSVISDEHIKTSKATLSLAEQIVKRRSKWLLEQVLTNEERETLSKNVSLEGDTYYRPLVPKKMKKTVK